MHGSVRETEGVCVCVHACVHAFGWYTANIAHKFECQENNNVRIVIFKEVKLQSWSYFSLIYEETTGPLRL